MSVYFCLPNLYFLLKFQNVHKLHAYTWQRMGRAQIVIDLNFINSIAP